MLLLRATLFFSILALVILLSCRPTHKLSADVNPVSNASDSVSISDELKNFHLLQQMRREYPSSFVELGEAYSTSRDSAYLLAELMAKSNLANAIKTEIVSVWEDLEDSFGTSEFKFVNVMLSDVILPPNMVKINLVKDEKSRDGCYHIIKCAHVVIERYLADKFVLSSTRKADQDNMKRVRDFLLSKRKDINPK